MDNTEYRMALQCTGDGCSLPHGYMLSGGRLSVSSRHHGQKHKYTITMDHLLAMFIAYGLIAPEMLRDMKGTIEKVLELYGK